MQAFGAEGRRSDGEVEDGQVVRGQLAAVAEQQALGVLEQRAGEGMPLRVKLDAVAEAAHALGDEQARAEPGERVEDPLAGLGELIEEVFDKGVRVARVVVAKLWRQRVRVAGVDMHIRLGHMLANWRRWPSVISPALFWGNSQFCLFGA